MADKKIPTAMERAFWEYSEPYTGMMEVDMLKSSHGRAFMAGWEAAPKSQERFSYWLKGYVELTDWERPSQEQWTRICEKLQSLT